MANGFKDNPNKWGDHRRQHEQPIEHLVEVRTVGEAPQTQVALSRSVQQVHDLLAVTTGEPACGLIQKSTGGFRSNSRPMFTLFLCPPEMTLSRRSPPANAGCLTTQVVPKPHQLVQVAPRSSTSPNQTGIERQILFTVSSAMSNRLGGHAQSHLTHQSILVDVHAIDRDPTK